MASNTLQTARAAWRHKQAALWPLYPEEPTSFRAAAEQRHVEAEYSLALFYLDGIGVERSVAQARRWFTAAASQGGEYGEAASLELEELRSL